MLALAGVRSEPQPCYFPAGGQGQVSSHLRDLSYACSQRPPEQPYGQDTVWGGKPRDPRPPEMSQKSSVGRILPWVTGMAAGLREYGAWGCGKASLRKVKAG